MYLPTIFKRERKEEKEKEIESKNKNNKGIRDVLLWLYVRQQARLAHKYEYKFGMIYCIKFQAVK